MLKGRIGVYDSGIGGVSVLKELQKELPEGDFIYLSDAKNNPYGDKEKDELKKIIFENINFLEKQNCKIIVIACNTATAVAIDDLRKEKPNTIFIGTEPAIKVAHDNNKEGKTLILATKLTLECERVQNLIHRFPLENLNSYPCVGLAEIIENKDLEKAEDYIKKHLEIYKDVETVILGCTHYPLILPLFQKHFKNAKIIDGSKGIARETKRKVEEINLTFEKPNLEFIDTLNQHVKEEIFDYYLKNDF